MKICAFSDMHGQYNFEIEPCDIVFICGDILPLEIQFYTNDSEIWLKSFFIPWCNNLPCEKVVFIAGNHDFYFMRHQDRVKTILEKEDKIVYLDSEYYEYNGKIIYGTPWCKFFGNWAFMESDEDSSKRYNDVGHIDILLSHDAPYGVSDILLQKDCKWADGSHIGNHSLRKLVETAKPQLMLHGHLHSCQHDGDTCGDTTIYCVSLLNENYKMVYKPLYLEID